MTTLKKLVSLASIGLAFGYVFLTICLWTIEGDSPILRQFTGWLFASAICGIASLLFEVEALSLPLVTLIHLVVCLCTALVTGHLLGYGDSFGSLLTTMLPIFIAIYTVVYIVCFSIQRMHAAKLNKRLNQQP